jgi:streptogramin lyase
MQVDKNDTLWFTSHFNDYLGRLDPQTGHITKYPLPITSDIGSREMFRDSQGRMWIASPPNDKIIYFTP